VRNLVVVIISLDSHEKGLTGLGPSCGKLEHRQGEFSFHSLAPGHVEWGSYRAKGTICWLNGANQVEDKKEAKKERNT
jgi:hypothetical protein